MRLGEHASIELAERKGFDEVDHGFALRGSNDEANSRCR